MELLRENALSGELVVIAEKRARRPYIITKKTMDATCPFCPGNERMTPATTLQFGRPWKVRCFQNKFPVFSGKWGRHEVVVDTPAHSASFSDLPADQIEKVLLAYSERSEWMLVHGMKYVLVCKNEGASAGASLSHSHSQVFGMSFVPPRVANELAMFRRYRNEKGACALCDETTRTVTGKRKILETKNFVVVAPYASKWQYESRIMPKGHATRLAELDLLDFARVLKTLVSAYNYYIRSAPKGDGTLHLHLDFFPRLAVPAGLEEGAGVFINQVPPEKAARALREKIENERK